MAESIGRDGGIESRTAPSVFRGSAKYRDHEESPTAFPDVEFAQQGDLQQDGFQQRGLHSFDVMSRQPAGGQRHARRGDQRKGQGDEVAETRQPR